METQLRQCANISSTEKHEKFYCKIQKQISSEEVFTVHNLVPLVPVGAFGAVLHGCNGRQTAMKVNSRCADTQINVYTNNNSTLPNEAQTDLPVAASNMGCFLAMLTLM